MANVNYETNRTGVERESLDKVGWFLFLANLRIKLITDSRCEVKFLAEEVERILGIHIIGALSMLLFCVARGATGSDLFLF